MASKAQLKKAPAFPSTASRKNNNPKEGGVNVVLLVTKVEEGKSAPGKKAAPHRISGVVMTTVKTIMKPEPKPKSEGGGYQQQRGPNIVTNDTPRQEPQPTNPLEKYDFKPAAKEPVKDEVLIIPAFGQNTTFKMYNCPPIPSWVIGGVYQLEAVMMTVYDRLVETIDPETKKGRGDWTRRVDYSPEVTGNAYPVCRTSVVQFADKVPFIERCLQVPDDFYTPETAETFQQDWADNHSMLMTLRAVPETGETFKDDWFPNQPHGSIYCRFPDLSTVSYSYLPVTEPPTAPEDAEDAINGIDCYLKMYIRQRPLLTGDPEADADVTAETSTRFYGPSVDLIQVFGQWNIFGPLLMPHLKGSVTGTVSRKHCVKNFVADTRIFSAGGLFMYCQLTPDMRGTMESAVSAATPILRRGINISAKRAIAYLKASREIELDPLPNNPFQWATAVNLCKYPNALRYDSLDDDQLFKFYFVSNHVWNKATMKEIEPMNDDEFAVWAMDASNAHDLTVCLFVAYQDGVEPGTALLETAIREGRRCIPTFGTAKRTKIEEEHAELDKATPAVIRDAPPATVVVMAAQEEATDSTDED